MAQRALVFAVLLQLGQRFAVIGKAGQFGLDIRQGGLWRDGQGQGLFAGVAPV